VPRRENSLDGNLGYAETSTAMDPSAGVSDEADPDFLAWNRLCDPIDVMIEKDADNWVPAGDWMISQEDHRLPTWRDLDRPAYHTLAG
jgi:hypothetical protein